MNVLHVMNAAGTLPSPLADEMRRVLEATLQRHTAQLGLTGVDVALRVLPWGLPETGIHGFAPTGSYVELTVSPDNPEFLPGWRTELPATLAHELHHARRWRGPGYGRTLLEVLVTEGLAQHHERTERAGQAPLTRRPVSTGPPCGRGRGRCSRPATSGSRRGSTGPGHTACPAGPGTPWDSSWSATP
ncbi:DUF2268 domain-containing putative Zn-dependent protease [Deinococcus aquaticus]|uniref:DUF2268 domain-containing putative Zn-dependent protease n=1 Tax=Deinococcus aquaticus TaxID=328692 RepID=UPI0036122715